MRRICITLEQIRRWRGPECQHFPQNAARRSGCDRSLSRILSQGGAKYTSPTKLSTAGADTVSDPGGLARRTALFPEQRVEIVADTDLPPPSGPIDEFGAVRIGDRDR